VRTRTGRGSSLKLRVNFLPEIIQLSKEVRNLKNLGFRVPLAIVNKAHQVFRILKICFKVLGQIFTTLDKIVTKSAENYNLHTYK
jgi:dynein heavy chain 1